MLTLLEALNKTTLYFEGKGVENSRLNAELLFAHVLQCRRLDLYLQFELPMSEETLASLRPLVKRRSRREPWQYIVGHTDFFNGSLKVDNRALIPRPETEELIELVTERLSNPPPRILDLGTGSGAIAIALARHFGDTHVLAVDGSRSALELAGENICSAGLAGSVATCRSDWFEKVDGLFDLIISNPPYLSANEWESAQPEVREHEPRQALVAENSGLACLNQIVDEAGSYLSPAGLVALETGPDQHEALMARAVRGGYEKTESIKDLSGRNRFILLWSGQD